MELLKAIFDSLFADANTLVGAPLLLAAIINALKSFNLLKDGQAGNASVVLNALVLIGLLLARTYGLDVAKFDNVANVLSQLITVILALIAQLGLTTIWHKTFKLASVPFFGKSYSK